MNKKQKIFTILALAAFLVLMWRDKWFYDFWFRGGEHRMTLIKASHAGPPVVPYPMESSYTIDSAAADFVALLVCYIGLFFVLKDKRG